MRSSVFFIILFGFFASFVFVFPSESTCQNEHVYVTLEEVEMKNLPALQSFVYAQHEGKWLFMGGRTDGLHDHRPPFAFLPDDANDRIYVFDPLLDQIWSSNVSTLPADLKEQLLATNIEFTEDSSYLYMVGGYGYSGQENDHITHPVLTVIDKVQLIDAIINGQAIAPFFRYITDPRMAVTGGYLAIIDSVFHLIGGQKFEGRYNPHGPNHGPGFIQEYTNAIHTFELMDDGSNISISGFSSIVDSTFLHRRDFNGLPQMFPDGTRGVTAFTGVFQHHADLPWLNIVDVSKNNYTSDTASSQLLNQYHSACFSAYDADNSSMHNFFFGGIATYYPSQSGGLWVDSTVPFVKTISRVTRFADGHLEEFAYDAAMPAYLGGSAAFIFDVNAPVEDRILRMDALQMGKQLIGYIYGGIESTDANIFMMNSGTSNATSRVFKVYLSDVATGIKQSNNIFTDFKCYPNPVAQILHIEYNLKINSDVRISIKDMTGQELSVLSDERQSPGQHQLAWDTKNREKGIYICELKVDDVLTAKKFSVQ